MRKLKPLYQYTVEDIMAMDYNHLIGIVKETNRPPGGLHSLLRVAQNTLLSCDKHILEVGTSTGFTAIELARLTGTHLTAIDINEKSLEEAATRAQEAGVENKIKFIKTDATKMEFTDHCFDMVFCGNVTSLVSHQKQALSEYCRVLKDGGHVVAIPMYYLETPPEELIYNVSNAIKVNISPLYKEDWIQFFHRPPLQLYFQEDYEFDRVNDDKVYTFTNNILMRPHLALMDKKVKRALSERYREFMFLFRDNLAMMGYTILILRKELTGVDPELFTSKKVTGAH